MDSAFVVMGLLASSVICVNQITLDSVYWWMVDAKNAIVIFMEQTQMTFNVTILVNVNVAKVLQALNVTNVMKTDIILRVVVLSVKVKRS
jgi:hypothetical protein